jgi:DNA helicase-2/ATP-dependent DNA helicase PcrA
VAALATLLEGLRQLVSADASPAAILDAVLERTGYNAELRSEGSIESEGRLENLAELQTVAAEYDTLDAFLESVALVSDADELEGDGTRVSLMTLHVAKGLEFPAVFLVGMEDGIFPHSRSLDDPAGIEEERRLFYVGITRARKYLYISHAWSRTVFCSTSPAIASRFMSEIPDELVRDSGLSYLKRPDPARLPGDNYRGDRPYRRGESQRGGTRGDEPWDEDSWDADSGGTWRDEQPYRLGASYGSGSGDRSSDAQKKPRTATGNTKRRLPKMAEERLKGQ